MTTSANRTLSTAQQHELIDALKVRFEQNMARHQNINWPKVRARLEANVDKLWALNEMEKTGGEPDVVDFDKNIGQYVFFDCATESPSGRGSLCYDGLALHSRKENKPKNSALDWAVAIGIELLTEAQYRHLQIFAPHDTKTSSWLMTPTDIRKLGCAIFGDYRYGNVFGIITEPNHITLPEVSGVRFWYSGVLIIGS